MKKFFTNAAASVLVLASVQPALAQQTGRHYFDDPGVDRKVKTTGIESVPAYARCETGKLADTVPGDPTITTIKNYWNDEPDTTYLTVHITNGDLPEAALIWQEVKGKPVADSWHVSYQMNAKLPVMSALYYQSADFHKVGSAPPDRIKESFASMTLQSYDSKNVQMHSTSSALIENIFARIQKPCVPAPELIG